MARYASFCLIMGPFKGKVPVFARSWPVMVRVRVSFMTEQYGRPSQQQLGFLLKIFIEIFRHCLTLTVVQNTEVTQVT